MINKTIDSRNSRSQKKKAFENSWSITYRKPNYDALGDPHASYYFLNKSMRKHLTSLRKSIEKQGAFVEKRKIRYMISERIRDFDNDNRATKVQAYYFKMKSSPSISSLGSIKSKKSLLNEQRQQKQERKLQRAQKQLVLDTKINDGVKQKSKTIQVPEKQRKSKIRKQIALPRISLESRTDSKAENKKSNEEYENEKLMKEQSRLTLYNKTQHNKFLRYILERKKKLSVEKKTNNETEPSKKAESKELQRINNN